MKTTSTSTIGQIVADDFRTAATFSKYNIDFCCKGHRTLEEVCKKRDIEPNLLLEELDAAKNNAANESFDYKSWPLDLLTDYIEKTHHRYIIEKTPVLRSFLNKLCSVHGDAHPELYQINILFAESTSDLADHMKKEEQIVFPFIRALKSAELNGSYVEIPHFGTIENQIILMKEEHNIEGERFKKIASLSNNYEIPQNACSTFRAAYLMLKEFESDLHKHIHMENNILFPKAIALEKNFQKVF